VKKQRLYSFILLFWIVSQIIFIVVQHSAQIQPENKKYLLYFPLFHLNEFFAGNMLGLFLTSKTFRFKIIITIVSCFSFITVLIAFQYSICLFSQRITGTCLLFYSFFFISTDDWFLSSIFKHKYLVLLGEISYGLYIYQLPVYKLSMFFFRKVLKLPQTDVLFYSCLFILIAISYISYKYIETPSVKYAKLYINKHFANKNKSNKDSASFLIL
jgi:peptidoglycan/LPS O-acetylase OafA/YrhL